MAFPRILMVRQKFPDRRIPDIPVEVARRLAEVDFASRLAPGSSVAIGVGSRGIANIAAIVRAVVDYWKSKGMAPFLFPAMGSHGAATAEGQAAVLAHYGITEPAMGCPVRSSLEVVSLGRTAEGIEVFLDRLASESAGIMVVGRVKWHTDFEGRIESGLFKMMAIGLGKQAGAHQYHSRSLKMGMEAVVRTVGRHVLAHAPVLGGLAILEDGNHDTAALDAVPASEMERREEQNLALVKTWMPRLPVDLDILIVDEIGKNISGGGMDTKIVNRGVHGEFNCWPATPRVERIFVRDLSPLSYGNGLGIGLADVITDRLLAKIDWHPTMVNSLTACNPSVLKTTVHFPTDRECLEMLWPTTGYERQEDVRLGWIRNTLELGTIALSEGMLGELRTQPGIEVMEAPREMPFGEDGNLRDVFEEG